MFSAMSKIISETTKRGALIVVEGCDRSGKTSQCNKIVSSLQEMGIKSEYMNFPNRTTVIGQLIDDYLSSKRELSNELIHLLFSANRWEFCSEIETKLKGGVTLIVDRYAFSGAAFTAAKGLDLDWCKSCDIGLPRPDLVLLLTLSPEAQAKRKGFGVERYEVSSFQIKVMQNFQKLKDSNWQEVDADRTFEEIHQDLLKRVLNMRDNIETQDILKLWKD